MLKKAEKILKKIEDFGFEAYFVGGCVRDKIMNRPLHDVDIATSALPEQIQEIFSDYKVIPTGIQYGTVTLLYDDVSFEITTFRLDANYSDFRRPNAVKFTKNIEEDLARRDFTMNAIAMDRKGKIIDPFGGISDVENKIIRCVGVPEKRFGEDALRIMRAVRFSSQLGFNIEERTSASIHAMCKKLSMISRERIRDELNKLILGVNCVDVLLNYSDVITEIIPEFADCIGFDQHSDYHCYNVWEHTVRAVASAESDRIRVRRALFFHDIGKPQCAMFDENGKGHFKGHASVSAELSHKIMKRLRYDSASIVETEFLIRYHSEKIRNKIEVKKLLAKLMPVLFFDLLELKRCDNAAKCEFVLKENEEIFQAGELAKTILQNDECIMMSHLDINGSDLIKLGFANKEIGIILDELFNMVLEEKLKNKKEELINYIKRR